MNKFLLASITFLITLTCFAQSGDSLYEKRFEKLKELHSKMMQTESYKKMSALQGITLRKFILKRIKMK